MMQNGDLVIPREPELLKKLRSIRYEHADAGTKIAAKRGAHDDIVMALLQACRCITPVPNPDGWSGFAPAYPHGRSGTGVTVPAAPLPRESWLASYRAPEGRETGGDQW